jgi:hypothetical protein
MRSRVLAALCGAVVLGVAGCGGDDESSGDKGSEGSGTTSAAKSDSPSHATVLKCLKDEGLEAEDQTSSSGKKIGIDYPAGRLVISFEKTAEDAETYGSVAKTNGDTAVVKGTIVASIPVDADAQSAQSTVEGCL